MAFSGGIKMNQLTNRIEELLESYITMNNLLFNSSDRKIYYEKKGDIISLKIHIQEDPVIASVHNLLEINTQYDKIEVWVEERALLLNIDQHKELWNFKFEIKRNGKNSLKYFHKPTYRTIVFTLDTPEELISLLEHLEKASKWNEWRI